VERAAVEQARPDVPWSAIGEALGVTKQAAAKRFGTPAADTERSAAPDAVKPDVKPDRPWEVTTRRGRVLLTVRRRAAT